MFSSLVRWFGHGSSGRGAGPARRFTPRLEALEDRAVPGGVPGGVVTGSLSAALLGAKFSGPSHVIPLGSTPAGVGHGILHGFEVLLSRSSGEEIPQ
jgi:hypothetical protein